MQHSKILLAGALLALAACTDVVGPGAQLSPESRRATLGLAGGATADTLAVGQSVQLTARLKSQGSRARWTTWSSSNTQAVTVTQAGLASAIGVGSAVVTASNGVSSERATIVVTSGTVPAPTPAPPPPVASVGSAPELPRAYVNTNPVASTGSTWTVRAGDDLQRIIAAAAPGDVIALQSGATFTGNFVLPAKSGDAWITITAAAGTSLPAAGARMTPAYAAGLPKLVTPNATSALATQPGAHHYRIVGIEVAAAPGVGTVTALLSLGTAGAAQAALAQVPHDLVVDRVYVHGNATLDLRRCVALNSASTGIVDSYLSDCHSRTNDSQAIMGWNGPGPYRIANNYLEAAGEVIMFGGGDPSIPSLVPSDIEVRHNHLTRPVSWKGGPWLIKNLFELKSASRVLVEGNVMENNWMAAQDGTGIVLKSTNQDGSCTWCGTTHVTIRLNIVRNTGAAFNLAAHPEAFPVDPMHSVLVRDNLVSNVNVGEFNGSARVFLTQGGIADLSIVHNTVYNETVPYGALILMGTSTDPMLRFSFSDNLTASATNWGVFSDIGAGSASMAAYAPGGTLTNNVFAGNAGAGYPTGNFFAPGVSDVGFTNAAGGDFSLLVTSPFKGKASDGKDPGANVSAVLAATNGVVLR